MSLRLHQQQLVSCIEVPYYKNLNREVFNCNIMKLIFLSRKILKKATSIPYDLMQTDAMQHAEMEMLCMEYLIVGQVKIRSQSFPVIKCLQVNLCQKTLFI